MRPVISFLADYSSPQAVGPRTVLEGMIAQEDKNRLRDTLEQLPYQYREVLSASAGFHPEGLSVRQLAKKWGVSTQRVYQIKKKAERLLQQALL